MPSLPNETAQVGLKESLAYHGVHAGSRLLAQAEQLAGELARHVGVAAPPSRIIHQVRLCMKLLYEACV